MKLSLSQSHLETLTRAPDTWDAIPPDVCISTLRLMGLVVIRDAPGERCLTRGFQWRITGYGFRLMGRKLQPIAEVGSDAIHRPADRYKITACRTAANQVSVKVPDAVSSALSKREAAQKRLTLVAQRAAAMKAPEPITELIQLHAAEGQI